MPGVVMCVIRPILKDCPGRTLILFQKDISDWLYNNRKEKDENMSYSIWNSFLQEVNDELDARGSKDD